MRSAHPRSVVRAILVVVAGAIACASCSVSSPEVVAVQKKVQAIQGRPDVTSFLDVRFGDSLRGDGRARSRKVALLDFAADRGGLLAALDTITGKKARAAA